MTMKESVRMAVKCNGSPERKSKEMKNTCVMNDDDKAQGSSSMCEAEILTVTGR